VSRKLLLEMPQGGTDLHRVRRLRRSKGADSLRQARDLLVSIASDRLKILPFQALPSAHHQTKERPSGELLVSPSDDVAHRTALLLQTKDLLASGQD
jgi:hypothetical protein